MTGQDSGRDGSVTQKLLLISLQLLEAPVLTEKSKEENGQISVLPISKEPACSEMGFMGQTAASCSQF